MNTIDKASERMTIRCYRDILDTFSDEEMKLIVQLKRFFECTQGDRDFGERFTEGALTDADKKRLLDIGVAFDPDELDLVWKQPEVFNELVTYYAARKQTTEPTEEMREVLGRYPLLSLWFRYNSLYAFRHSRYITQPLRTSSNPKLDQWRQRRVESTKSELGIYGHQIDHPLFAFELGDGCSVGCWFCAFATRKLQCNLDYRTKKDFFSQVIRETVDFFGQEVAGDALLYYGTEPHDNPNYLDYCRDFLKITGSDVCTSTAVTGDAAWIRSLIDHYRERCLPWPRLSVLTRSAMNFIHDNFSPDDLRDVELLMQMKDHKRPKVPGGRILKEEDGIKARKEGEYLKGIVPQGSIACVSGFLINLVKRTVQLVSPCYTSSRWPYGYRIFDVRQFSEEPGDFSRAVKELIETNMFEFPPAEGIVRFRDDLDFRGTAEGFDLVSRNQIHHYRGGDMYRTLGSMIAEGRYPLDELVSLLMEKEGINPMVAQAFIGSLFSEGNLDELYQEAVTP